MNPNAGSSSSTTGEVYVNESAVQAPVEQLPAVLEDEFWDYDKQVDLEGTCSLLLFIKLNFLSDTFRSPFTCKYLKILAMRSVIHIQYT